MKRNAIHYRWTMLALTLAAFALRMWRLGFFSLRGDEAFDVVFSGQPLPDLLYQLRYVQPYPPLFHTVFHFWLPAAGDSEIAVRFLAMACGTLVVPCAYVLGRQLSGARAGLLAALLMLVNPFAHWWAQDAHFYAYLLLLGSLVTVVGLRFWREEISAPRTGTRWTTLVLYIVVTLACFLTHYFGLFSWGALNLAALERTARRRWPPGLVKTWWPAQAVVGLVYLPWAIWTLPLTTTFRQPWIDATSAGNVLWRELVALNLGFTLHLGSAQQPLVPWMTAIPAAIALAGLVLTWSRAGNRRGPGLALTLFLAPLVVMYVVSLWRPLFDEKYAIALLPLYLVLLAIAILSLAHRRRVLGLAAALICISVMAFSTVHYATNEDDAKSPAWRELFHYLQSQSRPGDLLLYDFPEPALAFYNRNRLPVALVPGSGKMPREDIVAQLNHSIQGYERVWLVPLVRSWWDRNGDVPAWLDTYADRGDVRFFRGVHLALYLPPDTWQQAMTGQNRMLANGVELLGFRLGRSEDGEPLEMRAGEKVPLSLYWRAAGPTDVPYTVFTHLIGPDGLVYGQWDNPPAAGRYPTNSWQPGDKIVDQYAIPVAENAPPGAYALLIGMYDPGSGKRVMWLPAQPGEEAQDSLQLFKGVVVQ